MSMVASTPAAGKSRNVSRFAFGVSRTRIVLVIEYDEEDDLIAALHANAPHAPCGF
jgi:hypothetical protein